MAEPTQQQWQDLLNQITKMVGGINKVGNALGTSGNSGDRSRAANRLESEMTRTQRVIGSLRQSATRVDRASTRLADNFTEMTNSAQEFSSAFKNAIRGLAGGYAIGKMISSIENQTRTYQRLNDVGQTFGGSMLTMSRQAGAAGLSLEDFATMMEKGSTVAAALSRRGGTNGSLPDLALQVRKLTEGAGLYGMTLEALNEFTVDYAENLRLQGMLELGTNQTRADAVNQFAQDVSTFSTITGKSRREIAQAARDALRDVSVTSRLRATQDASQRRALEQATSFLAAIPGEAGTALSSMIGQTFGYGTALFADGARTFYEAGMGHIVSQFDRLGARIARGEDVTDEMFGFAEEFAQQVDAQREGLRLQALAGNESAKQILRMRDNMDAMLNLTEAEKRRMRTEATTRRQSTAFFSSFNSIFSRLIGSLREGLFANLESVASGLDAFIESTQFGDLSQTFKEFGASLGTLVSSILTRENIERFGRFIIDMGTYIRDFVKALTSEQGIERVGNTIGSIAGFVVQIASWTTWFASHVVPIIGMVSSVFSGIQSGLETAFRVIFPQEAARSIATVLTGFVAFGTFLAGRSLMQVLMGRLGAMTISAGVVNVNGNQVGGGLPGSSGGGGTGAGGGGWFGRALNVLQMGLVARGLGEVADAGLSTVMAPAAPLNTEQDNANWARMNWWQTVESGLGRGIEHTGRFLGLDTMANRAAEARIRDETSYFAAQDQPANQREISRLQRQYDRLTAQIEADRAANAYSGSQGGDSQELIELLRQQNELMRQIERRRSGDADRQIRATQEAGGN